MQHHDRRTDAATTPPLTRRAVAVLLAVAALLGAGCASHARWPGTDASPRDQDLAALVDSDPARLLLAELLDRGVVGPHLVARAQTSLGGEPDPERSDARPTAGGLPDASELLTLAQDVSPDFAALTFARALAADPASRTVQGAFDRFLRDSPDRSEAGLREHGAFPYTVLFAPAWSYRSHPASGADFARQRELLDRLGIEHRLIATDESGSVEANASTIAAAVREATRGPRRVIVVSASKSSAEVALALSRLVTPAESAGVAGWLNVAGALRGSPLADAALHPSASWLLRLVFRIANWRWEGVTSMTTSASRSRLAKARLPASIAVVNLVAVPVSGSIGPKVFLGYQFLREHGPNDGVVLLADTVWPGGVNLVALGADHLFSSRPGDGYDMALLRAVDFTVRRQLLLRRLHVTDDGATATAPLAGD
jgi:hypothetical protein